MITRRVVLETTREAELQTALGRIGQLEATLATTEATLANVTAERDKLRRAYEVLKEHYELLRRRLFHAKAERIDVTQLELEFAETKKKLDAMTKELGDAEAESQAESPASPPPPASEPKKKERPKPTGRRDLAKEDLPEERIELTDPALEGKAERIGFEESFRLGHRRASAVRVVIARAIYKVAVEAVRDESENGSAGPVQDGVIDPASHEEEEPVFELVTVKKPKELVERGLLAPSLIAHLLVQKYRFGIPFHRLAQMCRTYGLRVDDGTMCRYAEDVGATLGCIVDAMAKEARETAFCLSTDATGVCIQPAPLSNGQRQACDKGHFFVVLADQDHIFFEYQREHTSKAVCEMFKGFSGYIQADAHAIYDALFRGEARDGPDQKSPGEVGCWSHARRKFWEAATVAKDAPAREAILRIHALFELEKEWKKLAPQQRHAQRQLASRRLVDDFFAWAETEFARVKGTRGLAAAAFGYVIRQKHALVRFLDDGRLALTNNHSERALRFICAGRKSWLFFSSDDHASAAANLFSLIASCQLHRLDAETYLAEIIRALPHWPRDRYLELAPKYWAATRARLLLEELRTPAGNLVEIGNLTVPPPLPSQEQPTPR
jgi:hypothetical protein